MKICKLLVGLLLLGLSQQTLANNWYDRGNGGFVLGCGEQPLQVLDIYEAASRYFFSVKLSEKGDALEKAEEIIARLIPLDPVRAEIYLAWLKNFYSESQILVDTEFMETPDLGLVKKPKECKLEQVVFQREPSRLNPARYIINKVLWDKLDADNRAALIIHELIYRDFLAGTSLESTSERIRLFNAVILGDKLNGITLQEYLRILQDDLHLSTYTFKGITLFLGATDSSGRWRSAPLEFHNSDVISNARFAANQMVKSNSFDYFCMSSVDVPDGGSINFWENGNVRSLRISPAMEDNALCMYPKVEAPFEGQSVTVSGTTWDFYENGQVSTVTGTTANSVYSKLNYKHMEYERKITLGAAPAVDTYFRFDTDKNLVELSLGGRPCILQDLSLVRFEPSSDSRIWTVVLDKRGELQTKLNFCNY